MKERGMLFSAPMVRALLDGSKTQTRRAVKPQPSNVINNLFIWKDNATPRDELLSLCPYGQPGDRLWVRETWGNVAFSLDEAGERQAWISDRPATAVHELPYGKGYYSGHVIYRADGEFEWCDDDGDGEKTCWHPSIHMPREASRIDLEITGVRVERLQDISEADAIAEGAPPSHRSIDRISREFGYKDFPRSWYSQLWDQINGAGSWDGNPWVWVIEIKQIKKATPEQFAYMLPCAQLQAQAQETFDIPHFLRKGKD